MGVAGSANYANGTFTVQGAGAQIWGTADGLNYLYQPLSGDGTIVARIVSLQGGMSVESAGVMIRETLTAGSTNAVTAFGNNSLMYFDERESTGGASTSASIASAVTLPYWVKLVRSGNTFSGYSSADGVNWVQIGTSVTISMAQNVYVGLCVNADATSELATATFDNVSTSSAAAPAPAITSVSATSGPVGSQIQILGTGFGALQGNSLVTLNGTLPTVNSWSATSVTVTIPMGAISGPLAVSVTPTLDSSNPVTFTVTPPEFLTVWQDQDVGQVGVAGSVSYSNGAFTVQGAGAQIWGTADGLNYLYQPLSGDGTIVARVVSLQGGMSTQSAGVMIRETLADSSTNAYTAYGNQSLMYFDERTTTGGDSTSASIATAVTLPYWVKLVRSGSTFSGYTSVDGVNWVQIGTSQTIDMATNVYIGLAVNGDSTSALATATFDNVSTSSTAAPAPVITSISASTGLIGSQVQIYGTGFGGSEGSIIVTLNGALVTVNAWSATSVTVTIPTGATSGPLAISVAPSMNSSNPVTFTPIVGPLLNVWQDQDVGQVGVAGSATFANGTFTVKGSGQQIWDTADGLNFLEQPLSGDGTIVARLVSLQGGTSVESAGVMIRESLAAGSSNAYAAFGQNSLMYFDERTSTGGTTTSANTTSAVTLPYWVKLVRSGSTFSGYTSTDGVNWVQIGTGVTINMAANVYVGLVVNSDNNSALATATFDNVSLSTPEAPAPSITSVSASSGSVGNQIEIFGSGFGDSQSSSIVILNGALLTVNSWSATSVTVTIPTGATSGPLSVSVAPTMNSSNPVTFTVTVPNLPAGWLDQDVGQVGLPGNASYSGGTYTVQSSGQQIWGTSDEFNFVYQPLSGDGTIVARVVSLQGGMSAQSAGVMIRETLTTASTNAYAAYGSNSLMYFDEREVTNGVSTSASIPTAVTLPYWVELVRSGNTFSGYTSADGVNWVAIGPSQTISMAANVYIGLVVNGDDDFALATATFDNVSISSTAAPAAAPQTVREQSGIKLRSVGRDSVADRAPVQ